ncbi:hypothetical protein HK405_001455, partial [Cladochytrium tenue]
SAWSGMPEAHTTLRPRPRQSTAARRLSPAERSASTPCIRASSTLKLSALFLSHNPVLRQLTSPSTQLAASETLT